MRAHEFADQGAAGIVLYAEDTGRYGLQQRSNTVNDPGIWAAWGGGREPGETLEQCARRELAEEGGYTGPIQLSRLGENSQYVTFLGRVPHEFKPRRDDEWQDYCWVRAGDWPTPLHPGTAAALRNIPVKHLDESQDHSQNLDAVLSRCCEMIERGQQQDPKRYGQVAACVIDPKHNYVYGINLPGPNGTRRHAERVAIDRYISQHGDIPAGSIVVTTLSPCNSTMDERAGESCKDLLNSHGIRQVYVGYVDPTQHDDSDADFEVALTTNDDLWAACKAFADTFLHESTSVAEAMIGYLHFPEITVGVDEHAIERAQTHGIDPHDIDTVLTKLKTVMSELSALEVNNKVWVYDAVTDIALGLRRISSTEPKFKLKTVINNRPYDGQTPVVYIK